MYIIREERARLAKAKAQKATNKRSKSNANASSFGKQKSNATQNGQSRRQSTLKKSGGLNKRDTKSVVRKESRKGSFALNGILEDPLENVST